MPHGWRAITTLPLAIFLIADSSGAQDPSHPMFSSKSDVVLVPFHVARGNFYASDLKPADIILLEDGRPRPFTIFEGASTSPRTPLELVLLFDTNSHPVTLPLAAPGVPDIELWKRESTYSFLPHWDNAATASLLEPHGVTVASVYRFDRMSLQRLSRPTGDPAVFLSALQRLLTSASGAETIPIAIPPGRSPGNVENAAKDRGHNAWTFEAAIGALKDASSSPAHPLLMLVIFSLGLSTTTTTPEDVAQQAVALGVPIFPVLLNYPTLDVIEKTPGPRIISPAVRVAVDDFARLGTLTGGRSFAPATTDVASLRDILESVKNEGLTQYMVGFVPQSTSPQPRQHKLEIRLASKSVGKLLGGKRTVAY
jgi:hypothetical protein